MPSKYEKPIFLSSSGSAASTQGNLIACLITSSVASSFTLYDSPSGSSNQLLSGYNPANSTTFLDFSGFSGIPFRNGLYAVISSGANLYLWLE